MGRELGRTAVLAGVLLASGCPEPVPSDATPDAGGDPAPQLYVQTVVDGPVTLRDDVDLRILGDELAGQAVVDPDAITFPDAGDESLRGLGRGAILVSGAGAGFLRKVICVEGSGDCPASRAVPAEGGLRVVTSIATLGDVFRDASWTWTITTDPLSGPLDPIVAGLPNANVTVQAEWGVAPRFEVQVEIEDGAVTAVAAAATADLSLDWEASFLLDGSFSWARQENLPDLPVFPPQTVWIGAVPVTVSLDLVTTAGVGIDVTARTRTTLTGRCTTQVGGGLRYEAATQTWTLAGDATALDCPIDTPTLDEVDASANASLSLRPDLKLLVYGTAGVVAGLDETVDARLRLCPPPSAWSVDLTSGYHVGLVAPLLGLERDLYADATTIRLAGGDVPTPEICDYLEWAQWPIPADAPDPSVYAVTADTVTDTVTNLVWQQGSAPSSLAWQDAKTYCADLSLGDMTNWRLPTAIELQSILYYNGFSYGPTPANFSPAVFSGPFTAYWSASRAASGAGSAWSVDFSRSITGGLIAPHDISTAHAVRCVWSAPPDSLPVSRFAADPDGVRDLQTGLVWQATPSGTVSALADADAYCAEQGMRLPTIKELRSLVKIRAADPAIDEGWFPGTPSGTFWSSTLFRWRTGSGDYLYAWDADFAGGGAALGPRSGTPAFVRCVK